MHYCSFWLDTGKADRMLIAPDCHKKSMLLQSLVFIRPIKENCFHSKVATTFDWAHKRKVISRSLMRSSVNLCNTYFLWRWTFCSTAEGPLPFHSFMEKHLFERFCSVISFEELQNDPCICIYKCLHSIHYRAITCHFHQWVKHISSWRTVGEENLFV